MVKSYYCHIKKLFAMNVGTWDFTYTLGCPVQTVVPVHCHNWRATKGKQIPWLSLGLLANGSAYLLLFLERERRWSYRDEERAMRGTTQDSTRQRKVSCNCDRHFLKGPVDASESIARKGDLEGIPPKALFGSGHGLLSSNFGSQAKSLNVRILL